MASIRADSQENILVLTIDNQPSRNAFTHAMTAKLGECLHQAENDPKTRCVVITGAGDRAFSSGHDLNEMLADRDNASDATLNAPFLQPRTMRTPTIVAINGHAHAAGFILSLACDIRVCEEHADFAAPGARIGLLPIGGQISWLPHIIPLGAAYEILATGRRVGAEEALRLGLVNHVVPSGAGVEKAMEIASAIAANSSNVIASIKVGLGILMRQGTDEAERFEWSEGRRLQSEPDAEEGMRAFLDKRSPNFS
ncbi:enoyl-CoA hydratase/isomerase family protein [Hoeflea sp. G2-23]|uniref:Enoyl-CoA hydratase/isomerase family protein n=1 Tax=Hoeflea algicola TaxID=2983763 RepID=A0ABT3ZCU9_9HYPH|nr:enoyl-CoA hydratase/isomerase family protein [Hoeflea algicola]MCY0149630.1 enoyl-CoA hydratase/isomerase family protein [Hoeflea algicola]